VSSRRAQPGVRIPRDQGIPAQAEYGIEYGSAGGMGCQPVGRGRIYLTAWYGELYERDPEAWNAYLAEETQSKPASALAPTPSSATHPAVSSSSIPPISPTGTCQAALPRPTSLPPTQCAGTARRTRARPPGGSPALRRLGHPTAPGTTSSTSSSTVEPSRQRDRRLAARRQRAARLRVLRRRPGQERLRPYVWRRASAALEALGTGRARYLQDGYA
jgi:8-oxo-dGTP diphosphatase